MIFGGSVAATLPHVLFVIIDVALSAGLGVVRAWTIRVDGGSRPRRYRYSLLTAVLWGGSVLVLQSRLSGDDGRRAASAPV